MCKSLKSFMYMHMREWTTEKDEQLANCISTYIFKIISEFKETKEYYACKDDAQVSSIYQFKF